MELGMQQLLQTFSAAANTRVMKLDLERLEFREDGVHGTCALCGLTFELEPPAEAGSVSLVRDDASMPADQAYAACRSGSAL